MLAVVFCFRFLLVFLTISLHKEFETKNMAEIFFRSNKKISKNLQKIGGWVRRFCFSFGAPCNLLQSHTSTACASMP
jgi:hypothetical protein